MCDIFYNGECNVGFNRRKERRKEGKKEGRKNKEEIRNE